ncbi:alpha/beta fold hydrolase [Saccharomonospora sp. CUA-673]|uniref:alpha/beta fold hydrolase n=1 Tax=Saccharomonospora sp. CUA-673 TaxID=1904969 RepID=UPI000A794F2E|nr:alpha/beta fold hydrolase [Saccharomonospora sp. CUA-673]
MAFAALLPVVVLAACTVGPSTRPAVVENDAPAPQERPGDDSEPAPLPEAEPPGPSSVNWTDCAEETREQLGDAARGDLSYECATVTTTLDAPGAPGHGLSRTAVLKAGDGPIPLVVVNDVDGEPGSVHAARLAASMPDEMLERYSLVGVDRRGTGASDGVRCIPSTDRPGLFDADPSEDIEPPLDAARTAGQQCAINLDDEQAAFDSWRTTGDLETVREHLGVEHLHALGHGEGSRVLALYAARYPDKAGRIALDGMPDPSDDRPAALGDVAGGAEATLDAAGEQLGRDLRGDVTAMAERLDRTPEFTPDGYRMTGPMALRAVLSGLAEPHRWRALADAVGAARGGDVGGLAAFLQPHLVEDQHAPARIDGTLATRCNDTEARLPAEQITEAANQLAQDHPLFGGVVAQELVWCSPWPTRSDEAGDITSDETPPMVVVSTATDPVTPEQGTVRAAEQMPSAVHVAWQGAGHGALESGCVAEALSGFYLDGDVPRDGTLCPA